MTGPILSIKNSLQEDISAEQTSISVIENGDQTSYGIRADNSGDIDITSNEVSLSVKKTNELYKNEGTVYGIGVNTMNSLGITPLSSTVDINAVQDIHISVESTGAKASGIDANWGSNVNLHAAQGSVRISALTGAPDSSGGNVFGIKAENDSQINLDVGKDILITTHSNVEEMINGSLDAGGVWTNNGATATLNAEGILVIDTKDINSSNYGIKALEKNAKVDIMTQGQNEDGIGIYVNSFGKDSYASMAQNGNINVSAQGDIVFNSESRQNSRGVYNGAISTAADTILNANGNNILISAKTNTQTANAYAHGVYNSSMGSFNAKTELTGDIVSINSTSDNTTAYGIYADSVGTGKSDVTIDANEFRIITTSGKTGYGIFSVNANVDIQAINNTYINSSKYGVYAYDVYNNDAIIHINSENDNLIYGENTSVYSRGETADIDLIAGRNNIINAGDIKTVAVDDVDTDFGSAYGIYSVSGSDVTLNAGNQNAVLGDIYAGGKATAVSLIGGSNVIQSAANITNAGDLNDGRHIISSLYAENGAQISVSGAQNVIRTYAENPADPDTLERTIWAYNTADITIDGQTYISTDRYEETDEAQKGNSADIAIAAGTATGLDKPTVEAPVLDRATVSVKYDTSSQITGDILSAYQGLVDITPKNDTAQVHITGNILAGNNGVLNVNLGNGGTLTGRADDYGDAGVVDNSGHGTEFFDPAFSSDIFKGGEVNLTMGNNSRWNVTGQSWITRINTEDSSNVIIDLVSANTDKNSSAHALTVYEMNGDAVFNMSLDADRTVSDMVYMKNATGEYVVNVVDPVTQADMYAGKSDGGIFDGLRFATVGKGSKATFRAITWDQGINNIEYEVGTDKYAGNDENAHYDSTAGGTGNTEKPGTDLVEGFFDNDGTPGVQANGIMTMAARANENMGTDTGDNGTEVDETTNFKLIGVKSSEISDAGKTVVAMSRVNYANAVYMDRLNKRMGEARYIDGDEGLWVRYASRPHRQVRRFPQHEYHDGIRLRYAGERP